MSNSLTLLILLAGLGSVDTTATGKPLHLPALDGEYAVGYWSSTLDTRQLDHLTAAAGDFRRLALEIWYPAAKADGPKKAYAAEFIAAGLGESFPFPPRFAAGIETNAIRGAAPSKGRFPVVIFSHGLSWPVTLYQSLTEDLASRGYVVIGVNHPHGARIEYADGRRLDRQAWPQIEDESARQAMLAGHVAVWSRDLRDVIDEVLRWSAGDENNPLAALVDPARIGLAGHSFGGTAAAAVIDDRVKAVAIMEGAVRSESGFVNATAPLLHLIGGYNRLELEGDAYRPSPGAPVYQVIINGTGHAYFSDLIYLYRNVAASDWRARHRYEVHPRRVIQIARDYLAAFFGRYLGSQKGHILLEPRSYADKVESPSKGGYPEVDLSVAVD